MRTPLLITAILASATAMVSQDAHPTPTAPPAAISPVGADAVWNPPAEFVATVHKACANSGDRFGQCFTEQMQKAGASPAAIAFSRRTGNQGYLQAFRELGKVDIAFADYPYRANENRVCLLVNGSPATIDVDDPALLEKSPLEANPAYAGLLKAHPNATLFPGPRTGARSVVAQTLSSGGQRFVVPFSVHDGCHACAVLGQVFIAFVFDVEGRFQDTEVQRVVPRSS